MSHQDRKSKECIVVNHQSIKQAVDAPASGQRISGDQYARRFEVRTDAGSGSIAVGVVRCADFGRTFFRCLQGGRGRLIAG